MDDIDQTRFSELHAEWLSVRAANSVYPGADDKARKLFQRETELASLICGLDADCEWQTAAKMTIFENYAFDPDSDWDKRFLLKLFAGIKADAIHGQEVRS